MRPQVAEAIERLVADGATIIGPKPVRSPSLENYPACDEQVAKIGREVWGDVDGKAVLTVKHGKGRVYGGVGLEDVLLGNVVEPDVKVIGGDNLRCAAAGCGHLGIDGRGGIVFQHRTDGDREIYFLANTSNRDADFTASLRVSGRKPWLWDAVSGEIREAAAFSQKDGRTLIPLRLESSESIFIVLEGKISETASANAESNEPQYKTIARLDGPWTVRFSGRNAPERIIFDTLSDWSKSDNKAIRHYSGTAVYEKRFPLDESAADGRVVLELGEVGVIATVLVNGKEAGIVWTTPWEIDISGLVHAGQNELAIRVSNTWNNRLVADAKLPEHKRQSYVSQPYRFNRDAPLSKSGLIGPVVLKQATGPLGDD